MLFDSLKETYALSDEAVRGVKLGTLWTAVTNLVTMGGMAALFFGHGRVH